MKKIIFALPIFAFPALASAANQGSPTFQYMNAQTVSSANSVFVTDPRFGAKCNDTTDDTTAINNAIAYISSVGGGTVVIPGKCLMNGAMVIPYTGTTNPVQNPIRITGINSSPDSYLGNSVSGYTAPIGGATLDMRYAGGDGTHVAKIDTRGAGLLEIDHVAIVDGGTDNYQFLQTTNTTLNIHDVYFNGNPTCKQVTCSQNVILLGGNTTAGNTLDTSAATDGFQGYGTRIFNNHFSHIAIAVEFGVAANNVYVANNTVDATDGSTNTTTGAPYQFDGAASGNTIFGGIVEMQGYAYGVAFNSINGITNGDGGNLVDGLGLWDETMGSPTLGGYYFIGGEITEETIIEGAGDGPLNAALFGGPGLASNTLISTGTPNIFSEPTTFRSTAQTGGDFSANGSNIIFGKHLVPNGAVVTTSNGTVLAHSTDNSGTLTEGTASTGATLTFTSTWLWTPHCVVSSPNGAVATSYTVSTTALVINNASATGDQFSYNCQ